MFERLAHLRWPNQGRFVLAAIGMAMGLQAFTSFSGSVLGHGGGAFLIAYLVALMSAVIPVLALEFGVGLCYQASAPDGLRRLNHRLEWLGWWTTALAAVAALMAVAQLTWATVYGFDSLMAMLGNRPLPWGHSPQSAAAWFGDRMGERPITGSTSAAVAMAPVGVLVVLSALAWVAVHRVMAGGISAIGRWSMAVIPTAAIFLLVVGVVVLFRPGAMDGVAAFVTPRWSSLTEITTWLSAYRLAFTTHALGLGVYMAYASHLKRGADATGSAVLVGFVGAGFSVLAGVVVSAAAGAMAAARGVPLEQIAVDGPRAVFALMPTVCALVPVAAWISAVIALLLCLCWIALALSTVLGLVAAISLAATDKWGWSWSVLNARVCLGGFFASLVFASAAGPQMVDVLHEGLFPYGIAAAVAAQCLALAWVAGSVNLQRHLNAYSVIGIGRGWRILVMIVTPLALIGIMVEHGIALVAYAAQTAAWHAAEFGIVAGVVAMVAGLSLTVLPGRRVN